MMEVTYKLVTWKMVKAYCKFREEEVIANEGEKGHMIEYCDAKKDKRGFCKITKCLLWDILETLEPDNSNSNSNSNRPKPCTAGV